MLEMNEALISSNENFHPEQMVFFMKLAEKRLKEFLEKPYLKDVKVTPSNKEEVELPFAHAKLSEIGKKAIKIDTFKNILQILDECLHNIISVNEASLS